MLHPLVILLIGIVAIIGLIVVLRVNAFVALIVAAMLVSLLSPGPVGEKIARVAEAFGSTAAKIGVVIALAAVIGKCLMDSGAADRIVRGFQRLLGEKRASVALLASGFVLSMPVFFDTVFYLLVPLARSLWRRTRKNYVLYVTAIASGAAITHTLVPPTPGPLVMADNLKIDLGVMILMGTVIGLPMAVFALGLCYLYNRLMPIPMRPYSGEEEIEPLPDEQLPPLWLSLVPVLLPVVLISAHTFGQLFARLEHDRQIAERRLIDWQQLTQALVQANSNNGSYNVIKLQELLPQQLQQQLQETSAVSADLSSQVKEAITQLVKDIRLCEKLPFAAVGIPASAESIAQLGIQRLEPAERPADKILLRRAALSKLPPEQVERFNWLVFEAAFPQFVVKGQWQKLSAITAVFGDANLALLLSAVVAMVMLARYRRLSLDQLGKTTEVALMSAGVIILITAGGGAFGAMLREAGVKQSVEQLVQPGGQNVGIMMLVMGFVLAAVLKTAQGSSTVAIITTSAIMASLGASAQMLQCHPVYLAAAIGCGSLFGSWMNDSGFWIFARMGGFTEIEALKIWTVMLVLISTFGLVVTLVMSQLLPLA